MPSSIFHNKRREMEWLIGKLKHHGNLNHLPCGQFHINALSCTIGILASTLLVSHARYTLARIAMRFERFRQLLTIYAQLSLSPHLSLLLKTPHDLFRLIPVPTLTRASFPICPA